MKKLLLLLTLAILATSGGMAAGFFLRPSGTLGHSGHGTDLPSEYAKLNNQFIVPVVEEGRVTSMVVLTLSLEIAAGQSERIFAQEPKLRDAFLQVLFAHANAGGFRGSFTEPANLMPLRKALLEQAKTILDATVSDVLITDIARQDLSLIHI